jgi:hypothetical protein
VLRSDAVFGASPDQTGLWAFGTSPLTHYPWEDGRIYDDFGTNSRKATGAPISPLTEYHIYNVESLLGSWTSWINNQQQYHTASNTFALDGTPEFGRSGNDFNFKGQIAELRVYAGGLDQAQRDAIYNELYGTYIEGVLIPEPSTLLIWSLGLLGLAFCGRRRRKR